MAAGNGWDSGLKAMWRWAVVKAVVGYLVFVGPVLLVVAIAYDNISRGRLNRFEVQASLVVLLTALQLALLFQPWRRALWDLVKARKWQLGVWRDSSFASSLTREPALKEHASSLETEQLLACHKWPDHSAAARAVIRQELETRGLTAEAIDGWLPPASNITVPPRAPSTSLDHWQTQEALAFKLARFLAFAGLAGMVLLVVAAPIELSMRGKPTILPMAFAALILSWGALLLLVIPVGTLIRLQAPTRILLLRPFDQRAMTRTLKRIVLRHIGSFGHVYTLSDIHYRPNPFVRLGDIIATGARYAVAVLVRPSIRVATVKNARTYLALAGRLEGGLKPAFRHFVTGGQAFNIKSTNPWWQWCIDLLMHSSNAVVMDISRVSTGSAWEIEHIDVRDTLARTVFIAQEAHETHGSEALQRLLGDTQLPTIFLYTAEGEFKEPDAFRQALAAKVHGRPSEPTRPVASPAAAVERAVEPLPQAVASVEPVASAAAVEPVPDAPAPAEPAPPEPARPDPEPARVEPSLQAAARVDPVLHAPVEDEPAAPAPAEPVAEAPEPVPHAPVQAEPVPTATTPVEPMADAPAVVEPVPDALVQAESVPPAAVHDPMPQAAALAEPMPVDAFATPQTPVAVEAAPATPAPDARTPAGKIMGLPPAMAALAGVAVVLGAALAWLSLREDSPPVDRVALETARRCAGAESDWRTIEATNLRPSFESHLQRFPDCAFASRAQQKIEFLKDCEAYGVEASRLFRAANQEETNASRAGAAPSKKPGEYKPRDPKVCEHMERAIRYSDEQKRLVEQKKQTCSHITMTLIYDSTLAREHVRRYCRAATPPAKGKSKEAR